MSTTGKADTSSIPRRQIARTPRFSLKTDLPRSPFWRMIVRGRRPVGRPCSTFMSVWALSCCKGTSSCPVRSSSWCWRRRSAPASSAAAHPAAAKGLPSSGASAVRAPTAARMAAPRSPPTARCWTAALARCPRPGRRCSARNQASQAAAAPFRLPFRASLRNPSSKRSPGRTYRSKQRFRGRKVTRRAKLGVVPTNDAAGCTAPRGHERPSGRRRSAACRWAGRR